MTTLRNIWADLVEKRLWPVALVLAAGLLAVPLVLAKGGDEPVAVPAGGAVIAASAADDTEVVTLDVAPAVRRHDGRGRDPFVQPKGSTPEKAQALESSTTTDGGGSTGGGGGDAASTGTDTGGGDSSPSSGTKPSKPKSTAPTYTVDLRFGQADSMKTLQGRRAPHAAAVRIQPLLRLPRRQGRREDPRLPRLLGRQGDRRRHVQAEQERLRDHRAAGRRHRVLRPHDR